MAKKIKKAKYPKKVANGNYPFSVQLEPEIFEPFYDRAAIIGVPATVYARMIIQHELEKKTIFKKKT